MKVSSPLRFLRIITSVNSKYGGPIEGVKQITKVLTCLGHETEIVSLDRPDSSWIKESGLSVHALGKVISSYGYTSTLTTWLGLNASNFDVVIVHGLWQYTGFGTWCVLRKSQTPYFVYPHGMLDPWFKQAYPLKHLKKMLYWRWGEYRVLRDARAVLFTCEEERLLASKSFWPYKCQEAVVSYGTSEPSGDPFLLKETFLKQYPELRGKRLFLFLSRIHVKKGCDLLLDGFAKVANSDPALHLVMAGPDQSGWQVELQRQAERLGIASRITWTGMLSGDLKWGAYHASEVFVLPSHQENFGIVVAEAMACGKPVLISNKINIWREIENDGAGLVANDDLVGTVSLLNNWIALPEIEKETMRRNAKSCFSNRFEIHQAARSLLDVLSKYGSNHPL